MSDTYALKECSAHGHYVADSCPRCDTIAHTNYTYCKKHKVNYRDTCERCTAEKVLTPLEFIKPIKMKSRGKNNWKYRGLLFDSSDEALRYGVLSDLQEDGIIRHLCVQPTMIIRSGFELNNPFYVMRKGGKPRTIPNETYTPDYAYVYDGLLVIEDVKGSKKGKPYSKANSDRSQKHLLYRYKDKHHVVFVLSVRFGAFWRYFQASTGYPELEFELKAIAKDKAA